MTIKGVLFDFSGTLCRIEPVGDWLDAVLDEAGIRLPDDELRRYTEELEATGALPGGPAPQQVPPHLAELWATRDESAERHRAAYTGLSRQVALPDPALHDALYDRHRTPAAWHPYPDAAEVLSGLRGRGISTGLISNIGWDPRPVLDAHGIGAHLDAAVLSYEHEIQKPDPRLFRIACEAIGHDPRDVLMVGDDRSADGGALDVGCAVHFVDHVPVADRPDGLRPVLDLVG
ncbi:HAD family hydrolase [Streptomyces beijiangensis]|uniref:HAD-IA family hydrolase n=1 Tax=Streptomyces beijiangensis TaxID=163361 RepID=A0A939JFZ6_9ACTN|nr:HAD-IA family hydrolase [Streptomyces beijiangensis]MBO0511007.1 HAD-IA family hydrolase [Streptomyces beijiangensis]